jgi:hypothetical protein
MRICTAHIESLVNYCQSRYHGTPKEDKESHDEYERRTWREKMHSDEEGFVLIPPMSLKFAIDGAAKKLRIRIPGKGNSEWGKILSGGVTVLSGAQLNVKKAEVEGQWLHLNADGRRGGGKRVLRCMPTIPKWKCKAEFYLIDDAITKEIFQKHLDEAGQLIGIGQHRPENGGFCGRFKVTKYVWDK